MCNQSVLPGCGIIVCYHSMFSKRVIVVCYQNVLSKCVIIMCYQFVGPGGGDVSGGGQSFTWFHHMAYLTWLMILLTVLL